MANANASKLSLYGGIAANIAIANSKFVAAYFTGSSAMAVLSVLAPETRPLMPLGTNPRTSALFRFVDGCDACGPFDRASSEKACP